MKTRRKAVKAIKHTLLNLVGRDCGTDNTGAGEVSMAESGNFLLCQGRAGVWVFHPLSKLSTLKQFAFLSPLQVDLRLEQYAVLNVSYVTM